MFFALCCIFVPYGRVNAYAAQDESVNDKLNEEIDLVIEDIDLSELENYISDISDLLSDKSSLKNLLLKKPLNKITINDIAEDCGINRMTFYYHFQDIRDLVEWTCLDEVDNILKMIGFNEFKSP